MSTVVLDNGGCTLRVGWGGESSPRISMPNCTARLRRQLRVLVGDETLTRVKDPSQLFYVRPVDGGVVTDAACQELIWSRALRASAMLASSPGGGGYAAAARANDAYVGDSSLLLTVAPAAPPSCLAALDELVFEQMGFASYVRATPQALAAGGFRSGGACGVALPRSGTGLVVDVGFSATHAVPVVGWLPELAASRRLDVGGKLLTNALKEALSYRQFNLMEDTAVVGGVKEALCFVAQDFPLELAIAQRLSAPGALVRAAARGAVLAAALGGGGGGGGPAPLRPNPYSHAVTHPQSDGVGVGIRREYVLPDYVNVERGYVRGGADDPAGAGGGAAATAAAAAVAAAAAPKAASAAAVESAPPQKRQRAEAAVTAAAMEGVHKDKKRKGKSAKGSSDDGEGDGEGGEGEEEEDEEDDDDDEEEEEDDEDEGGSSGGDSGEYRGSRKARAELAAVPAQSRRTSARAAKSGVTALTAALRRDGVLAEGDEDSEGGGELEQEGGRRGALGVAPAAAALRGAAPLAVPAGLPDAAAQTLVMCAERIAVPEILFNPGDTGLRQGGLPAAIAAAIAGCAPHLRPALWGSIVLTGGGAAMPGLEARLAAELRKLAPAGVDVALYTPQQPALAAWRGGATLAADGARMQRAAITKQMWREEGAARIAARLAGAEAALLE